MCRPQPHYLGMQAARSQALLETAMPADVARALLRGASMASLSAHFESASVAFIALAGFDELMATLAPDEQLKVRGEPGEFKNLKGEFAACPIRARFTLRLARLLLCSGSTKCTRRWTHCWTTTEV